MSEIDIDVKAELNELKQKVRKIDKVVDFNSISYTEFVPFVFKLAKKFDKRLDEIEARLDAIDKAFQDSLERFPA
jgi:tetrahydromethanopterin S-methyltransferase subunit G